MNLVNNLTNLSIQGCDFKVFRAKKLVLEEKRDYEAVLETVCGKPLFKVKFTGTLKSTPLPALYRLNGISPPEVRRETIARVERSKQLSDPRHPLDDHQEGPRRL